MEYLVRLILKKRSIRELETGIIYLVVGGLGVLFIKVFPDVGNLIPPCLFRLWSGIPCPSCGGTNCAIQLVQFHFWQAFLYNPFIFIVLIFFSLWGMNTLSGLVFRNNIHFVLNATEKKALQWIILLLLPVNWIYLIMRTVFTI